MDLVEDQYHSLKLFGRRYHAQELKGLAFEKIKDINTPEWEKDIFWFLLFWLHPSEHIFIKTSGSTGKPKVLKFKKNQLVQSAKVTADYFDFKEDERIVLALDMAFVAAKLVIVRALVSKMDLYYVQPSANPMKDLTDRHYDFIPLVPYQIHHIFKHPSSLSKLRKIKNVLIGGGHLNRNLQGLCATEENTYFMSFGMAETLTHFAIAKIVSGDESPQFQALPQVSIDQNESGCLTVFVPWISDEIIHTRDIVKLVGKASFVWEARLDNLINSGGIKIFPEIVEAKIQPLINRSILICALPDELLGERIVLLIEGEAISFTSVKQKISDDLNKFEMPKETYFLPQFMYTKSKKINRKATIKLLLASIHKTHEDDQEITEING